MKESWRKGRPKGIDKYSHKILIGLNIWEFKTTRQIWKETRLDGTTITWETTNRLLQELLEMDLVESHFVGKARIWRLKDGNDGSNRDSL